MFHDFHYIILRAAASLELATIIAATATVHLAIVRALHVRELNAAPRRAREIERSYRRGRTFIAACAAGLVCVVFLFDVRDEIFDTPPEGSRLSAAGFLFVVWALIAGAWSRATALPHADASSVQQRALRHRR